MRRAALALALLASAAGAAEETDLAPEFGALEGAELSHVLTRSFDSYALPVGRFTRDEKPTEIIEGSVREFVYRLDGESSTLEAIRNYGRRFAELGYAPRFECAGEECGGFDFRFGVFLVEPPAMRFDLADFRYLAVQGEGRAASVLASRQGGRLYVQIVAVAGESAPERMTPAAGAPPPPAKPGDARLFEIARRLTEEGRAPLEGVAFEPGAATMTAASADALAQVAALLGARPDLLYAVVGHSDNQGGLEANLALSRARAEAVAKALLAMPGVQEGQVTPHGVAWLAPRASNATEAGRALNRRVELVLQ